MLNKAGEEGNSHTAGGNANWYHHYGKQYGDPLKHLKKELPYDPANLRHSREKPYFVGWSLYGTL